MELEQKISGVKPLREILGDDLNTGVLKLQAECHPDRHPQSQDEASALYSRVSLLADSVRASSVLKGSKREFNVAGPFAAGDIADLYFGWAGNSDYVVKISRVDGGHQILEDEMKHIKQINDAAFKLEYQAQEAGSKSFMTHYFPVPSDSFPAKDKIQKRVNVFMMPKGYYPLSLVNKRYPKLDGRHVGWIFRRLLLGLNFVHDQGLIHGAVLPSHILINPETHGVMLVGWGQSVPYGAKIRFISRQYRDWYPCEVMDKKPVTFSTDIYMAAISMAKVMGVDGPPNLQSFFKACCLPGQKMRLGGESAAVVREEFTETLSEVYGEPRFALLTM